jgi:5-formyltetrahydrofolate cyclo-ligase
MMNAVTPLEKTRLRNLLRQQRQTLSLETQQESAVALTNIIGRQAVFQDCETIAAYCAYEGEIDPQPILLSAFAAGKKVFLPTLHPETKTLQFLEYQKGDPLNRNRLGILEPTAVGRAILDPSSLQLVLLPLVAFDHKGQRLGRGGGYYDKTFAFLQQIPRPQIPYLLGLAYEFQEVNTLLQEPWDISLSAIATEKRFIPLRNTP